MQILTRNTLLALGAITWLNACSEDQQPNQATANELEQQVEQEAPQEPQEAPHDHNFPYAQLVHQAAAEHNLPEGFLRSVIRQESDFDANAERYERHIDDTSYGLMQILTQTARGLANQHPTLPTLDGDGNGAVTPQEVRAALLDPATNIAYGTQYLADGFERYDNLELAAATYNAGIAAPFNALLQQQINQVTGADLIPDGNIGSETRGAVRNFQRAQNLAVDGIPGRNTRARLNGLFTTMFPDAETPTGIIPQNGRTPRYVQEVMGRYNGN